MLKRPWVGILVLAWLSYMNPQRLCYSFAEFGIPFYKMAAGLTMLSALMYGQRMNIPWTSETILLALFSFWTSFTTLFATNQHSVEMWLRVLSIQISIFMTLMLIRDPLQLRWLIWVIVLSLDFYGFKGGLFTIVTGGGGHVIGPRASFIADNNALALALSTSIPLLRYLQITTPHRLVRLAMGGGMGLTAAAIVGTFSRGGLLALATTTFLLVLKSKSKFVFAVLGVVIGIGIASVMPKEWFDRMKTIETYDKDGSVRGRFEQWQFAIKLANDRPLTGGGFEAFDKASTDLRAEYAAANTSVRDAHSIYFKVLGEHGYVGLIIFLSLGLSAYFSGGWIKRATRGHPDLAWASDLASICQVSLITYAVGGAFLGMAYFDLPYHIIAFIVLTKTFVRAELAEKRAEARREETPRQWLTPAGIAPAQA
jgi:probable O-glycosylation ligase (exosortase A-associated)